MALVLPFHPLRSLTAAIVLVLTSSSIAADRYGYDALGRLTSVRYENGLCAIYTYDANGNLVRRISNAAPQASATLWGGGGWSSFDWISAPHWHVWGEGGAWGCFKWAQ